MSRASETNNLLANKQLWIFQKLKKTYSLAFGSFLAAVLQLDRKIALTRDLKVKERYARACPKRGKGKKPQVRAHLRRRLCQRVH